SCRGGGLLDVRKIDPGIGKKAERFSGKGVLAHGANHPHGGARPARRERLISALSAGCGGKAVAGYGLARRRQPLHTGNEIEIDRADDGDHGALPPKIRGKLDVSWPAGKSRRTRSFR